MQNINFIKKKIKEKNFKYAEKSLKELISKDNNNYEYTFLLGYTYELQGNFNNAVKSYVKAKLINKTDTVHNFLGNLYIKNNCYDEALVELSESIKINNKNSQVHNNYGLLLVAKNKEVEGSIHFKKAISLKKDYMDPKYNLLEIYEKTNDKISFNKLILKEINEFPKNDILKFYYSIYLKNSNKKTEAIEILESINFINHKQNWEYRKLNLIGTLYDEIKKYGKAFVCHKNANKYLLNNFCLNQFEEKKYLKNLNKYLKISKKEKNIKSYNIDKTIKNLKIFFLVGFPRSGTTMLDRILSSHKKIFVLEERPLIEKTLSDLTDDGKINFNENNIDKLRKKYLTEISKYIDNKSLENKIIVDKMPLNIIYSRTILKIFPNAKIILSLRHPLDCVLSCFFKNFVLNDAMINFLDLKRTANIYSLTMKIFNSYNEISSQKVLKIKYESVVSDFENQIKLLTKFMNVDYKKNMKEFYKSVSKNKRIRTASYDQVGKPLYKTSVFKWKNYQDEIKPVKKILENWISFYEY